MSGTRNGSERRFRVYTSVLAVLAAASMLVAATGSWDVGHDPVAFGVLAAFTLASELLSVPMPTRGSFEDVTMSPPFALAILVLFGPGPGIAVYAVACLAVELRARVAPTKLLFNVAQYTLAMSAAALVLQLLTGLPIAFVGHHLLAVVAAGAAFFVFDNVLTGIGAALLAGESPLASITREATFHAWTTGSLVALGPIGAVSAQASPWLVPFLSLPMVAIYVGGRQAVAHNHRLLHDELTELPNRRLLRDQLSSELTADRPLEVTTIDLVDFRSVNEALGHRHGDALLRQVATRLATVLGEDDTLARLGSDEFALIRLEPHGTGVADLMRDALAAPFEVAGVSLEVHAVLGAARFPVHGRSPDELLRHAGAALHRAKEDGTPSAVYDAALDEHSVDRLVLAGQLGRAIEAGQLRVEYQPKLALTADRRDAVEALVRWRHPELGEIQPDGFVPLAERTGLMRPLTDFVLRETLRQCAEWAAVGLDLSVAVNLSPRSLLDAELPAAVESALEAAGVAAGSLQLEVTESSIVADAPRARDVLMRLRDVGVSVAIDDFGTGYSSLAQLQSLPVDEIKIDRSFVTGMLNDDGNAAIVRSIVDLGRNLGLAVTAEGVEDEATAMHLMRLGCDYLQGFHIGAPRDARACRELLAARLHARRSALQVGNGLKPVPSAITTAVSS